MNELIVHAFVVRHFRVCAFSEMLCESFRLRLRKCVEVAACRDRALDFCQLARRVFLLLICSAFDSPSLLVVVFHLKVSPIRFFRNVVLTHELPLEGRRVLICFSF